MKRVLAVLLCFSLMLALPMVSLAEKNEMQVEVSLHAARFSFEIEDQQYVLVEYATSRDTGKMVLYAADGHFEGTCYLPGTDTEDNLRINVSNMWERTLMRHVCKTVAAEAEATPATDLDPAVRPSSDAENVALSVDENGLVHYSFTVPGRESVLLRTRTPQESHTVRLAAASGYLYEGTAELPLSYPDDAVTVTILTDGSNHTLFTDDETLRLPYDTPVPAEKATEGRLSGVTVCIDPGHQRLTEVETVPLGPNFSKKSTTTVGMAKGYVTQRRESIVVLEIAFKLRDALLREGAEVIMTRESQDVFVGMLERADIPNNAGADMVLRLHCNSRNDINVKGIQVYCPFKSSYAMEVASEDDYRKMGFALLDAMKEATGTKRGDCKLNNNYVGNNWSKMPSFLVEMGYLSNREEDMKMATEAYQDLLVAGMVEGAVDIAVMRGLIQE